MKEHDLLKLYDTFLSETKRGKRLQKNRKRVRLSSAVPYVFTGKLLEDFSLDRNFPLRIRSITNMKKRELAAEKKYWNKFYLEFTAYLYEDLDCYDNYVGANIRRLRAFFNYLNEEKEMNIGNFYKRFYACSEEIEIITLLPEQLNFLIFNTDFENSLPDYLKRTKDMFVFGCTVALRVSDIFKLTMDNIEVINSRHYLRVSAQKTGVFTRVLLPDYAVRIIKRQKMKQKTIFGRISNGRYNLNLKELMERTGWTEARPMMRTKRGIPTPVYKNRKTREQYRFCDLVTSHTMRKTGITTMLCLGMSENAVRKISGHAANSKEFFRYVQLSQFFMDTEAEKVFEQLKMRVLEPADIVLESV
ncbi:MAG: tyrosine-type recombinase/integrase [Bacteroidia bacterium]